MLLEDTSHRLNCVSYTQLTISSSIMVVAFVIFPLIDIMLIDGDTPVDAPANQLAHGRTAGPGRGVDVSAGVAFIGWNGDGSGEGLRNENAIALCVGGHRMRARRLRDGLDQDTGGVDHPKHGSAAERRASRFDRPARAEVVAAIAFVEPDLIRAGDAVDVRGVPRGGVDDERARIGRNV